MKLPAFSGPTVRFLSSKSLFGDGGGTILCSSISPASLWGTRFFIPMDDSSQIPGFREMDDWPTQPVFPLTVTSFDAVRGGGHVLDITDSLGTTFPFFFERFLGRLCYGSRDEYSDDAAFVTSSSQFAFDVFDACESAITSGVDFADRLRAVIDRAIHWSPR